MPDLPFARASGKRKSHNTVRVKFWDFSPLIYLSLRCQSSNTTWISKCLLQSQYEESLPVPKGPPGQVRPADTAMFQRTPGQLQLDPHCLPQGLHLQRSRLGHYCRFSLGQVAPGKRSFIAKKAFASLANRAFLFL